MTKPLLLIFALASLTGMDSMAQAKGPDARTVDRHSAELSRAGDSVTLPSPSVPAAVTPIWGAGAPAGNSDGQFANAFVQAGSFAAGNNPTSWTALSVNDSGGANAPGSAYWTRSLTGRSQGAYAGATPPVSSPSQTNGVAIFDSDYLDNAGTAGAFGSGSSPSPHRGELISPRINLTGYTNVPLAIRFYTRYRTFDISELSISMSTNDGATWSPAVDYRTLIASTAEGFITVNFYAVTAGVANLSQCRVRLAFEGDYYYAIVDDLQVQTAIERDLTVGVANAGGTFEQQGDVIQLTGNRYFPISQMTPDARHFAFGGNIRNLGTQAVLASANPRIGLSIERNSGGGWTQVYSTSAAANQAVPAGGYVFAQDLITNYSWVQTGDYRAIYTAIFDGTDENPANDSLTHYFTITADDYASKVDLDANGHPLKTGPIIPAAPSRFNQIEFGSVFDFESAASANLTIDSLSFTYRVPTGFSPTLLGPDQDLTAMVYTVDRSVASIDSRDSLTPVGLCAMHLTGLGTTIAPGQYGTAQCTPTDMNSLVTPMPLASNQYFISIRMAPPQPFEPNDVPWFGVSEVKNYHHNMLGTQPGAVTAFSPVAIIYEGAAEQWYAGGFTGNFVPSIGIHLGHANGDLIFKNGFE